MSDIKEINGKFYDFDPPNKTFITTAKELKTLGVKNYYFMLRIDNPVVANINLWNPRITRQEIQALLHEFDNNMWSFMRMAVRLRTDAGIVPYGLHRGLAAAAWCFERNQDHCLCEPRQTWKTTGMIAGPIQWAFQFSKNLKMHFFGKETQNTKRNLASLKDDISLLPEWMQFKRYYDENGKIKNSRQSAEVLENSIGVNKLTIHPKPTSLSHAEGLARGDSGAIMYYDEIEHTPFINILLENSYPAFKTAHENALSVGQVSCRTMSCTPGNLDTKIGRDALPIIKSMFPWTEKIYDMTEEEIKAYKQAREEEYNERKKSEDLTRESIDCFYIEYQYYQVRKTYDWVLEQLRGIGNKMTVRREILMQRLRGSSESPISPEDLEYLIANMVKSDRDIIINEKWRYRLYNHGQSMKYGRLMDFDERIPYIVGVDPASGGGGDNFSVTIVNPYNLKIAAEFKSPYISGPAASQMLVTLVEEYIPNCVITIEKNSMGIYLIQMINEQTSIGDRLYWSNSTKQLEEMTEEGPDDYNLKMLSMKYKKFCTYTSPKIRNAMFELLFAHIDNCKQILNTEYLVDDLCKLVRNPNTGKIAADKGEHDDCVMSYLHAIYIYYTGDNLETFGIIRKEHPIWGDVDPDREKRMEEKESFDLLNYFSTSESSYEKEVVEATIVAEEFEKLLVDTLDFMHHDVYSKRKEKESLYDTGVDLSSAFFDQINGII